MHNNLDALLLLSSYTRICSDFKLENKNRDTHACLISMYIFHMPYQNLYPPLLHPLQTFHPKVDNNFFFFTGFDIRIPPTVDLQEFEDKLNKWRSEAGADVTYKFFAVIRLRYGKNI